MKTVDVDQVRQYLKTCGPNTKLYFGCDSERFQSKGVWVNDFALVCVVHRESRHGCKIFGEVQRERDYDAKPSRPSNRLMSEAYKLVEFFNRFEDVLLETDFDYEIHLDINPIEHTGSNIVIQQAVGYVRGTCNVMPLVKPDAWAASYAADRFKTLRGYSRAKAA